MNDTKMLQAILDTVTDVGKKVDTIEVKMEKMEKRLTKRIDNLGRSLAYLEDDCPTMEDFENLESRVVTLEHVKH